MSSVDVVIPCYNYAHYLPFAVDSALNQRDVDVRVLILDDQSPDNTAEVAAELAARDQRISYRRNEKNLGLIGTANAGIDWVSSEYYVLLSADDALTPGALARAAQVMNENAAVDLVFGPAIVMGIRNPTETIADPGAPHARIIEGMDFIRHTVRQGNPVPSPAAILRTSAQKKIGAYHPAMKHTSDLEMWLRYATRGPVAALRETQAYYRVHEASMSTAYLRRALSDRQEIIETLTEVFSAWRDRPPETRTLLAEIKRRYANEAFWLASKALEDGDEPRTRERLAFALRHHPNPALAQGALKLKLMRMMGRAIWNRLAELRGRPTGDAAAQNYANAPKLMQAFGGWPHI